MAASQHLKVPLCHSETEVYVVWSFLHQWVTEQALISPRLPNQEPSFGYSRMMFRFHWGPPPPLPPCERPPIEVAPLEGTW